MKPSNESEEDGDCVARVLLGDTDAFETLVRRHLPSALAVATSVLRQREDAEDACQEAFIIALKRIRQCRSPNRFRAWLLTIVRNQALHGIRERRHQTALAGAADTPRPHTPPDPLFETWRSEVRGDVGEAMETLTLLQRSVLVLHDMEGWRHRDIAERLGITPGSSRVHLHVARRYMRDRLGSRYAESHT